MQGDLQPWAGSYPGTADGWGSEQSAAGQTGQIRRLKAGPRDAACRAGVAFGISSKLKFCFSDQLNLQRDLEAGREIKLLSSWALVLTHLLLLPRFVQLKQRTQHVARPGLILGVKQGYVALEPFL